MQTLEMSTVSSVMNLWPWIVHRCFLRFFNLSWLFLAGVVPGFARRGGNPTIQDKFLLTMPPGWFPPWHLPNDNSHRENSHSDSFPPTIPIQDNFHRENPHQENSHPDSFPGTISTRTIQTGRILTRRIATFLVREVCKGIFVKGIVRLGDRSGWEFSGPNCPGDVQGIVQVGIVKGNHLVTST